MQATGGVTFIGGMSLTPPPSALADVVLVSDHATSPYIHAYRWDSSTAAGFGTKYSNPAVLPGGGVKDAIFDVAGSAVLFIDSGNNSLGAYSWISATGFGAKLANKTSLTNTARHIALAPTNDAVLYSHNTGLSAVRWNPATGYGTAYTDHATQPPNQCDGIAFCGSDVIVNHFTSPFVSAYAWNSNTGFGTKRSNPSTIVTNGYPTFDGGNSIATTTGAVIMTSFSSPYIFAYAYTPGTGFGTKYSNPGTLPPGLARGVAVSPDYASVAVASGSSPYVTAYPWNNTTGFGTKYANPSPLPTGAGVAAAQGVAFSPNSDAIFVNRQDTITAYAWTSASGFGTKYSSTVSPGSGNGFRTVECARL